MPRGDRTGPEGMGPMTGRAAGFCAGNDEPGFGTAGGAGMFLGWGRRARGWAPRGAGMGRHFVGRGRCVPWAATPWTQEDERQALTEQASGLERMLQSIQARLSRLEEENKD